MSVSSIIAQSFMPLVSAQATPPPSDSTLNMHCVAVQRFACASPPESDLLVVDPEQIRVGWRRRDSGAVDLVLQYRVTMVNMGSGFVLADFGKAEHTAVVATHDMGPWMRGIDGRVREWFKGAKILSARSESSGMLHRFHFALEHSGDTLVADRAYDLHVAVLQRFVVDQPPMFSDAMVDPTSIKVGWSRSENDAVNLCVQVRITELKQDGTWVPAKKGSPEHRALANRIDVRPWLAHQDRRARAWISAMAAKKAA